jgi:hypothetical protein
MGYICSTGFKNAVAGALCMPFWGVVLPIAGVAIVLGSISWKTSIPDGPWIEK